MRVRPGHRALGGALLWALLALPAPRHLLEATMTRQMLVQLPLLALAGWCCARARSRALGSQLSPWNQQGVSGLLLASLASLVWMLPLMLDRALGDPMVALWKFLSVPLLIGAPIALSWPRAGFVVRGLFLAESVAMALRLGWLYLISPVRLCNNYLLDDQQRLGKALLAVGFAILLLLAARLLWGHVEVESAEREGSGALPG